MVIGLGVLVKIIIVECVGCDVMLDWVWLSFVYGLIENVDRDVFMGGVENFM